MSFYDNHRNRNRTVRSAKANQEAGGDEEILSSPVPSSRVTEIHHHHYHYYDTSTERRSSQKTESTCATGKSVPSMVEGHTGAPIPTPEDLGYGPSPHHHLEGAFVETESFTGGLSTSHTGDQKGGFASVNETATTAGVSFAQAPTVVIKTEHHYHHHYHYDRQEEQRTHPVIPSPPFLNVQMSDNQRPPTHHPTSNQAEGKYRSNDSHLRKRRQQQQQLRQQQQQQQQQVLRTDGMDDSSRHAPSIRGSISDEVSDRSISSRFARSSAPSPSTTTPRGAVGAAASRRESMKGSRATSTPVFAQNDLDNSTSRRRRKNQRGVGRRDSMNTKATSLPNVCNTTTSMNNGSGRYRSGRDSDKQVHGGVDPPDDRWSQNTGMDRSMKSISHNIAKDISRKSTMRGSQRTRRASMGSVSASYTSDHSRSFVKSPVVREKGNLGTMKTVLSQALGYSDHTRSLEDSSHSGKSYDVNKSNSTHHRGRRHVEQDSQVKSSRILPSRQRSCIAMRRESGNLATLMTTQRRSLQHSASTVGVSFTDAAAGATKNSTQVRKGSRKQGQMTTFVERDDEVSLACSSKASRRSSMPVLHVSVPIGPNNVDDVPNSPLAVPSSSSGHVSSLVLSEAMTATTSETNTSSQGLHWPPRRPSRMLPFLHNDDGGDDSSRPSQRSRERSCSMPLLGLAPVEDGQKQQQHIRKSDVGATASRTWKSSLFDHTEDEHVTDYLSVSDGSSERMPPVNHHHDESSLRDSFYQRIKSAEEENKSSFALIGISAEELGYGDMDDKNPVLSKPMEDMSKSAKPYGSSFKFNSEAGPRMPRRSLDMTEFPEFSGMPKTVPEENDNEGGNRSRIGSVAAPRMPRRSVDGTVAGEDIEDAADEMSLNSAAVKVVTPPSVATTTLPSKSGELPQRSRDDVPVKESDPDAVGSFSEREDSKTKIVSDVPVKESDLDPIDGSSDNEDGKTKIVSDVPVKESDLDPIGSSSDNEDGKTKIVSDVPVKESDLDPINGLSDNEDSKILISKAPLTKQTEDTQKDQGKDRQHDDDGNEGGCHNDDSRVNSRRNDSFQAPQRRHTLSRLFNVQKKKGDDDGDDSIDLQYVKALRGKEGPASMSNLKYLESFEGDSSGLIDRFSKRRFSCETLVNFMKARMENLSSELVRKEGQ